MQAARSESSNMQTVLQQQMGGMQSELEAMREQLRQLQEQNATNQSNDIKNESLPETKVPQVQKTAAKPGLKPNQAYTAPPPQIKSAKQPAISKLPAEQEVSVTVAASTNQPPNNDTDETPIAEIDSGKILSVRSLKKGFENKLHLITGGYRAPIKAYQPNSPPPSTAAARPTAASVAATMKSDLDTVDAKPSTMPPPPPPPIPPAQKSNDNLIPSKMASKPPTSFNNVQPRTANNNNARALMLNEIKSKAGKGQFVINASSSTNGNDDDPNEEEIGKTEVLQPVKEQNVIQKKADSEPAKESIAKEKRAVLQVKKMERIKWPPEPTEEDKEKMEKKPIPVGRMTIEEVEQPKVIPITPSKQKKPFSPPQATASAADKTKQVDLLA